MEQANIAEQLAGNRQQNVFYSVIGQFQEAENAMAAMTDSEGALSDAYAEYSESVQKHINTLKASFQDLSTTVISSNLLKGLSDIGSSGLSVLNSVVGALDSIGGLLPGILSLSTALIARVMRNNHTLDAWKDSLLGIGRGFRNLADSAKYLFSSGKAGSIANLFSPSTIGVIVGLIAAVVSGISSIVKKVKEQRAATIQAGVDAGDEAKEFRAAYDEYERLTEAYNNNRASKEELSAATDTLLASMGKEKYEIGELADEYGNLSQNTKDAIAEFLALEKMRISEGLDVAGEDFRKGAKKNSTFYIEGSEVDQYLFDYLNNNGLLGYANTSSGAQRGEMWIAPGGDIIDFSSAGDARVMYEAVEKARNALLSLDMSDAVLRDSQLWQTIDSYLEQNKDSYDKYTRLLRSYGEDAADSYYRGLGDELKNPQNISDYKQLVENMVRNIMSQPDFRDNGGTEEDARNIAKSYIESSRMPLKEYDLFKDGLKGVNTEVRKLINNEGLSADEAKRLTDAIKKMGYSTEEAVPLLARLGKEIGAIESPSIATDSVIGDLATMRDELAATAAAIEEYNNALKDGEKGDLAKQYKSAYDKAIEDIKAGRTDSRGVNAAALLAFGEEGLARMGYDADAITKALESNEALQAIFSDENTGVNFANYLKDNIKAYDDFVDIMRNSDGTFDIAINDVEGLADALGVSVDMINALRDDLDAYGPQRMMSDADLNELHGKFSEMNSDVNTLINTLAGEGLSGSEILSTLHQLDNAFDDIDFVDYGDNLIDMIKAARDAVKEKLDGDEESGVDITTTVTDIEGVITAALNRAQEIADDKPIEIQIRESGENGNVSPGEARAELNGPELGEGGSSKITADPSGAVDAAETATSAIESVPDKDATISTSADLSGVDAVKSAMASVNSKTVFLNVATNFANIHGLQANAGGTKNSPGGPSLVNELGPELISENGRAYIAGGGRPTVVNLSPGAIVLDAEDTKRALSGGKPSGAINAYAMGYSKSTPVVSMNGKSYYVLDGGNARAVFVPVPPKNNNATVSKGSGGSGSGGGNGGGNGGGGSSSSKDNKTDKVDWIEVAIDRLTRAIDSLGKIFSSAFKTLGTRMEASTKEISKMHDGLLTYQAGYERYLKEANSVGLSAGLVAAVQKGAIDISSYDADTKKKIEEYKQWYEKALDCKKAIDDLHESLAELYKERFDLVQKEYEDQLGQLEHQATMVEKNISMVEQRGYLNNASFYQQLVENESQNISKLRSELSSLQSYFDEAMSSGEIEENSEAWYEMKSAINDVEESIADANIQLVEYQKNIRKINWEYFDYAQERFEQLTNEAEFYISLMQNDELFDDRGQLMDSGIATMGMRVMNYNAYMAQADAYAQEMQRIQRELARDPYDTELISRRENLIKLQQQSILSADGEKDAIRDLVENGINKELSALKELIDAYNDSLDSAKDLYEYQKRISEKTQDIAKVQKQLSAYANDTSDENRARIQKLNEELKKTQTELEEAERDQSISEQKKLLDNLYTEYEELLNERLDNIDALVKDMVTETNGNLVDIRQAVEKIGEAVGYTITGGMEATLYGGGFSNYDKTFENFTVMTVYLEDIFKAVDAMARASGAVKAYASGGLVDYTGLATVHGTKSHPELVLNASDTANFLSAAAMLKQMPVLNALAGRGLSASGSALGGGYGTAIGTLNVTIPIDHVQDYNDMISQMRDDPKFERLVNVLTLDAAVGKSSFRKNSIKF